MPQQPILPLLPYSTSVQNTFRSTAAAKAHFEAIGAVTALFTELGQVFLTHNVQDSLGIVLLKRQYLLKPGQRIVNFDAKKTRGKKPWDQDLESKPEFKVDNDDDNFHSSAWCVSDQGLAPFEYTYRGHGREIMPESLHMQLFFLDLSVKLQKLGLADVFGVCALLGNFTGEAVPMGDHATAETEPHPDGDHSIIVGLVWQFSATPKDGAGTWIRGPPYENSKGWPRTPIYSKCRLWCKIQPT